MQTIPLQDSDYQEVDYYLQEQADRLSPEVKTIIAQAFKLAEKRTQKHAWRTYPNQGKN